MQHARRQVAGVQGPLLVPSFSSKDFDVNSRLGSVSHLLDRQLLVSAFDLYHGLVDVDHLLGKKLVFVDSGGYEFMVQQRQARTMQLRDWKPVWSEEKYRQVLERLPAGPRYVVTSFDAGVRGSIDAQADRATRLFSGLKHARSFLAKPQGAVLDEAELSSLAAKASRFEVLGVAEEDLGHALVDRVRAIHSLRKAVTAAGSVAPIHVFGCLNLANILAYTAAGADIFDGLSWCQYAYDRGHTVHIDDYTMRYGDWRAHHALLEHEVDAMNLRILAAAEDCMARNQGRMAQKDLLDLVWLPWAKVGDLLKDAGVS